MLSKRNKTRHKSQVQVEKLTNTTSAYLKKFLLNSRTQANIGKSINFDRKTVNKMVEKLEDEEEKSDVDSDD